jgi:hypothetical protein
MARVVSRILDIDELVPASTDVDFGEAGRIGTAGEIATLQCLADLGDDWVVLHDVNVPTASGSTQLDVVLVSPYGVWCLEIKAWAGRVYGQEDERSWTQVKLYGRKAIKERRDNPVQQNAYHCRALSAYVAGLGYAAPVRSIVVFTEAELRTNTRTLVIALSRLVVALQVQSGAVCLTPEQVLGIAGHLRRLVPAPTQHPSVGTAAVEVEAAPASQRRRPQLLARPTTTVVGPVAEPTAAPPAWSPLGGMLKVGLALVAALLVVGAFVVAMHVFVAAGQAFAHGKPVPINFPTRDLLPVAILLWIGFAIRAFTPERRGRRRR